MRVVECVQGSPQWIRARLGVPTASQFHRIYSPARRRPSKQRDMYLLELLDEWSHRVREDPFENHWTRRGQDLEPLARFDYTMTTGAAVREVGFILRGDGLCGCSPDGLVGDDTVLEIKAKSPHRHARVLAGYAPGHTMQCQGLLYVTERPLAHLWHFCTESESVLTVIERDDDMIQDMIPCLNEFIEELEQEKRTVALAHGRDYESRSLSR